MPSIGHPFPLACHPIPPISKPEMSGIVILTLPSVGFSVFCLLIYLFLSVLGLHCYTQAFSSCGEQGLLSSWGMQASVCRTCALGTRAYIAAALRLSSCDAWVSLPHGMWDLPQPGIKHVSPASIGRFFSFYFFSRSD